MRRPGSASELRHRKAWWDPTRSICRTVTKAPPERRGSGWHPETANRRFELLLMAFGGVATKHLDSFLHCFEWVGSCRPTSLRTSLTAASTQPLLRFAS